MNNALLHGLPLLAILAGIVIYVRTGKRRPTYTLSQPWTHDPILWAATGEVVPGRQSHGQSTAVNVGGGASGRW